MLKQWILAMSRSKIFISICAVAFTATTMLFEKKGISLWYPAAIFFATLITYRASVHREPSFDFILRPLNVMILSVAGLCFFMAAKDQPDPLLF